MKRDEIEGEVTRQLGLIARNELDTEPRRELLVLPIRSQRTGRIVKYSVRYVRNPGVGDTTGNGR